jgi:predicted NUDIX family NTP pyrophosphohydrolase
MPKLSAGLLVYRLIAGEPEVLLVHPGGPYWEKKDDGFMVAAEGGVRT